VEKVVQVQKQIGVDVVWLDGLFVVESAQVALQCGWAQPQGQVWVRGWRVATRSQVQMDRMEADHLVTNDELRTLIG
jgi:hypothetical protein